MLLHICDRLQLVTIEDDIGALRCRCPSSVPDDPLDNPLATTPCISPRVPSVYLFLVVDYSDGTTRISAWT